MKALGPIVIFVIGFVLVLGIIAISGEGLIGIANLIGSIYPAEMVTIDGQQYSLVARLFGYYICEPSVPVTNKPILTFSSSEDGRHYIECPGNAPECKVSISCDGGIFFLYQQTNNPNCEIVNDQNKWCDHGVSGTGITEVVRLKGNERLRIGRCTSNFYLGAWGGKVYESYTPYQLTKYGPKSGRNIINAGGCILQRAENIVSECGDMQGKGDTTNQFGKTCQSELMQEHILKGLSFGESVDFVDIFVDIPVIGNIQNYNGQNVFCQQAGQQVELWSIGIVETKSMGLFGSITTRNYAMPKDIVDRVECCNGDKTKGYICENWKWKVVQPDKPKGTCFTSQDCTNRGMFYSHPINPNLQIREECRSSQCVVVETKAKQCDWNKPCPKGYSCNMQTFECEQTVIVPICGDGVCQTPYENEVSCAVDCKIDTFDIMKMLSIFIVSAIISVIILFILWIFTPVRLFLRSPTTFIIAVIILTIILTAIFAVPIASIAATLI